MLGSPGQLVLCWSLRYTADSGWGPGCSGGFTLQGINLFFLTPTDTSLIKPLGKVFKGLLEFLDYHR